MPKPETHPDEYGELMIESKRVCAVGPDDAIVPLQFWDMDDADKELSVVFRVKGFREVERLFAVDALVQDAWYGDGELVLLTRDEVHRHRDGAFGEPSITKLPIRMAQAMGGSATNLLVVGEGIARFDGTRWTKLAPKPAMNDEGLELTCVTVRGDVAYAGGKSGALFEIVGDEVKRLDVPFTHDVTAVLIDGQGMLSVATRRGALQGPPTKLVALELPPAVDHALGLCEFKGEVYWACVGDGAGMGVVVQRSGSFEPVISELAMTMSATDRFLYLPSEAMVGRYDGDDLMAVAVDFDQDESQWRLVPMLADGEGD